MLTAQAELEEIEQQRAAKLEEALGERLPAWQDGVPPVVAAIMGESA